MSEADNAQYQELRTWESINNRKVDQTKFNPGDSGYGPIECDECGADMITQRREWGFNLCLACAQAKEKQNKRY